MVQIIQPSRLFSYKYLGFGILCHIGYPWRVSSPILFHWNKNFRRPNQHLQLHYVRKIIFSSFLSLIFQGTQNEIFKRFFLKQRLVKILDKSFNLDWNSFAFGKYKVPFLLPFVRILCFILPLPVSWVFGYIYIYVLLPNEK